MLAALWDSPRLRAWAGQALLLFLFVGTLAWLAVNTVENLAVRSIRVGFDFLSRPANFPISESVIPYSPANSFAWAYVVGIGNTLMISALAILFATLLGLFVGLARRSAHPMLSGVAGVFVTAVRNTPLIVQLLFWNALATTALPAPRNALHPLPGIYLSQRGLYLPGIALGTTAVISPKYAPEVRERAVRMVFEHEGEHASQWAAIGSIAAKIGCNPETLRNWVRQEVIRCRGPWRTLKAVEFATLEWVDWFNHRRLFEPIGNIPPAEAEARYYAQTKDVAMAA